MRKKHDSNWPLIRFPLLVSLLRNIMNSPCYSFTFVKSHIKNTLLIPSPFYIRLYTNYQEVHLKITVACLHFFFLGHRTPSNEQVIL